MITFPQLCGITAAVLSPNYPVFKLQGTVTPSFAQKPLQSLVTIMNASLAYGLVSRAANAAHPIFEGVIRTTIRSQQGQVALFVATIGALYALPEVIARAKILLGLKGES